MSKVFRPFGALLALCAVLALVACKEGAKPSTRKVVKKKEIKVQKDWLKDSWMEQVLAQPKAVPAFFQASEERRNDLAAMWENRWHTVAAKARNYKSLKPGHRAVLTRLNLRLARFYMSAYELGTSLNMLRLEKRRQRVKSKSKGALLAYYYGRQLCLIGRYKAGQEALTQAQKEAPASHQSRIAAWKLSCVAKTDASKAALPDKLKALSFAKDKDGVAELTLLQHYYDLKMNKQTQDGDRSTFFGRLLDDGKRMKRSSVLQGIVETEEIKQGEITATLEYHDPLVYWALMTYHARQALSAVSLAEKVDRYAPFYKAEALLLLKRRKEAKASYQAFLKNPPKKVSWPWMLFSRRWSPGFLQEEARFAMVMMQAARDRAGADKALQEMAAKGYPLTSMAALGRLMLSQPDKKALRKELFGQLRLGAEWAEKASKELFVRFTKAGEVKAPKGATAAQQAAAQQQAAAAGAIIKWQLYRYTLRPLYLWASRGALMANQPAFAERWMERLHRKDTPYQLGGMNEAYQFILTAHAYLRVGKMGISTLYFAKCKQTYPSLTQLWSLLRTLRLYKGASQGIMIDPKGG